MALTPKMERFAQNIALRGMNQTDSWSEAYGAENMTPTTITKRASELATRGDVAGRIAVLSAGTEAAAVKAAAYNRDRAMAAAQRAEELAHAGGQSAGAVAAVKLQAQLAGLLDEKKQDPIDAIGAMDVEGLLKMRTAVEREIAQARELLELTGEGGAAQAPPAPMRRVIG